MSVDFVSTGALFVLGRPPLVLCQLHTHTRTHTRTLTSSDQKLWDVLYVYISESGTKRCLCAKKNRVRSACVFVHVCACVRLREGYGRKETD